MMMKEVLEDVMPCMVVVVMEACAIGLTILASTVMAKGMSPFVFVVYTNALASVLLLPSSFFPHLRKHPFVSLPILTRIFFLGMTGIVIAQNLASVGLSYSSPILACGMGNLIPSFSFLLPVILRVTKFDWRRSSDRAKLMGTLISILGAVSITLYRGPVIRKHSYSSSSHLLIQSVQRLFIFSSTHENWLLGAILLAAASFAFSAWNIIQIGTLKHCPEPMEIASAYTLAGTVQTAILSVITERNPSAWRLKLDMEILAIVLTAVFGSVIRSRLQLWCVKVKGPLYVSLFKPLGIPISTLCGCVFFAESFHYGSIMGAAMVGTGYYTMMWGHTLEDEEPNEHGTVDSSDEKAPLLPGDSQV
ncbi:hypothetical protein NMG60_11008985 [Bertholletia excelsa]